MPDNVQGAQDMAHRAFGTSLSADQPLQTSPEPTPPAGHVAPKPIEFGLSLIKPAGTHAQAAPAFVGWPQLTAGMGWERRTPTLPSWFRRMIGRIDLLTRLRRAFGTPRTPQPALRAWPMLTKCTRNPSVRVTTRRS